MNTEELSDIDPSKYFVNILLTKIQSLVKNWDDSKPSIRICELKSISNTAIEIAEHQVCNDSDNCICPTYCDCEGPDSSPALVSNHCPEHNINHLPVDECPVTVHRKS